MHSTAASDFAELLKPYGIDLSTYQCRTWGDSTVEPMLFKFTNASGAVITIDDVYLDKSGSVIQYGTPTLG